MGYSIPARWVTFEAPGGVMEKSLDEFLASPYALEGLPPLRHRLAPGQSAEDAWKAWRRAAPPSGDDGDAHLLLILTDQEPVQRLAVRLKLARRMPTVVMRWWDTPFQKRKTWRNRLLFNRYTGINFVEDYAAMRAQCRAFEGGLMLDNPVALSQEALLGAHSRLKMLRHTLQSLVQPNRVDIFGRTKRNHGNLRLTVATHFYCNQQNIHTVTSLLAHYATYPAEVLDRVQFVVVDDGSPIDYEVPQLDLNLTWVKVNEDIRWNQAGARNLALHFARSNNVVISDVDHLFPAHTLRWLAGRDVGHKRFYKFHRKMPDGSLIRGHPNIFYLSRARWFQLFGTDEEFAGAYGAEDFRFVKNMKNHGTLQSHLPKRFHCEERVLDRAKSYHSLVRDLSFNTGADTRKRLEAEYFGADPGHSRSNFNFTWRVLLDRDRECRLMPPLDRGWRSRWLLRTLAGLLFCRC